MCMAQGQQGNKVSGKEEITQDWEAEEEERFELEPEACGGFRAVVSKVGNKSLGEYGKKK